MAQFLTQRALEQEQARVEALQASLIEKQRLRREARYYASLQFERDKAAEALRKVEEEARRAAEERRRAEEAAKAAEEERRKEETEAKRKADEAAKAEEQRKSEEDARRKAEEAEAKRKAEEAARKAEQTSLAEGQKPQSPGKAGIERAPLPPPAVEDKAFDPEAIGNFLKTLGE